MPNVNGWDVTYKREVVKSGNIRKVMWSANLVAVSDDAAYSGRVPWALQVSSGEDEQCVKTMTLLSETKSKLTLDVKLATESKKS